MTLLCPSLWDVQCHNGICGIKGQLIVQWYMAWCRDVLGRRYVVMWYNQELTTGISCHKPSLPFPHFPYGVQTPLLCCLDLSILNTQYWPNAPRGGYSNSVSVLFLNHSLHAFLALRSCILFDCALLLPCSLFAYVHREYCFRSCHLDKEFLRSVSRFDERCLSVCWLFAPTWWLVLLLWSRTGVTDVSKQQR